MCLEGDMPIAFHESHNNDKQLKTNAIRRYTKI